MAATAVGALAIGAVSVGSLAVGRGRVKRLRIDDLEVGQIRLPGRDAVMAAFPATAVASEFAAGPQAEPRSFEDFAAGQQWRSGTVVVTTADIKAFAAAFDPQPFHLDEAAAAASPFGRLVASGWHTAALTMRLLTAGGLPMGNGIIGAGGEITWPHPVYPGDRLSVASEVLEVRPSRSKPEIGLVTVRSTTSTAAGVIVQILKATLVVPRRQAEPDGAAA